MEREKKTGILLILIGVFIPVISILFSTRYGDNYAGQTYGIVLRKAKYVKEHYPYITKDSPGSEQLFKLYDPDKECYYKLKTKGSIVMSYKIPLGFGITLVFIGVGILLLYKPKTK